LELIRDRTRDAVEKVYIYHHGHIIEEVASQITETLRTLLPEGSVSLLPQPPDIRLPDCGRVELRLSDGSFETTVGRHGHGIQRALLLTLVQRLAVTDPVEGAPGLFLVVEEPEIFQHPLQARHLARVLESLARPGAGSIQIAFSTHSAVFAASKTFHQLRRFARHQSAAGVETSVSHATRDGVAQRLIRAGIKPGAVEDRLQKHLSPAMQEAFFARRAVVVEGQTDGVLLSVAASKYGFDLDALGIAIVEAGSKDSIPVNISVLRELGVPVMAVFDADQGVGQRARAAGRPDTEVDSALRKHAKLNRRILECLDEAGEDWPAPGRRLSSVVLDDCLDCLVDVWPEWQETRVVLGVSGQKSGPHYTRVAEAISVDRYPLWLAELVYAVVESAPDHAAGSEQRMSA